MEERKWEDLSTDCLVNIFGRLGVESVLVDVPLVCKPWYKATLTPLCWQQLVFPFDIFKSRIGDAYTVGGCFREYGLIKHVVKRSQRSATLLVLPNECTRDELIYVSDECPALKCLVLPSDVVYDHGDIIPGLISKWKSLEMLRLGNNSYKLVEILYQISLHCKNFVGLSVTGAYIEKETASKIGCKELMKLDVRNCIGFDEDDDEIIKLASQINNFCCEGSKLYDSDDYYEDHISFEDFGDYYSD